MKKDPVHVKPTMSFEETLNAEKRTKNVEPKGNVNKFKLALSIKDGQLGWLGMNGGQWAILTNQKDAVTLELYPYKGVTYYRIVGTSSYMSVSDGYHYVGFYGWLLATGFTRDGKHLISDYTGQKLSYYSKEDGYLYANNSYTVLEVEYIES